MTEVLRRGVPGMKSVKDLPAVQDMPPPGGFPAVRFARRLPNTGPSGAAVFAVSALIMGYGFYKVGQGNIYRRHLKAEKAAARESLLPLLQAEEDRRFMEVQKKHVELETKIMANTPGWKVNENVYNNGKWYPPMSSTLPGMAPYI
eukprot:CAMPEP_0114256966 /NCGR_PEP_ID=MMETSP0058-20121206/18462_1 /TAXON_ID=36894 /ORGANISM="Pyramimonas parkeae, CCMP726" /LENGTH=145 /DNA_ID=CAMNT_0001371623 /DNA_START=110 /DNA_END=547 /DNA_ORIENTATION=+